jgi:SP family myo-inositol transporter-like MFS transporter 13
VSESPRWLFKKGKRELAYAALLRSRSAEQADLELKEMEEAAQTAEAQRNSRQIAGHAIKDSLLRRKYVIPFLLACIILFCNTATGVNSILGYNTSILLQGGLSDVQAHWGYVIFTLVNFGMTMVGMDAGGSQGAQVPAGSGHQRHHRFAVAVGVLFLRNGKEERGLPQSGAGHGGPEPGTNLALRPC